MANLRHILGVILAGGQSRRFGGGDKGLADLAGRPVLAHVIEQFRPQVEKLALNVNGESERFATFGLETFSDGDHPGLGPLSGVLAAIDRAQAADFLLVATVSTDVPFIPDDLVQRLEAARGNGIAIAASGGRRHPTVALWPVSIRERIVDALEQGALGVNVFTEALNAVAVPFPMREIGDRVIDPFFNVNTPDDLAAARALLIKQ